MSSSALKDLYYDPKSGLGSLETLYKEAKQKDPTIKRAQVKKFLEEQETVQVHKQRHVQNFYPITAYLPFQRLQIDLLDMSSHNHRLNKGKKWIFTCIDVYTRYAFAVAMKTKNDNDCLTAFRHIINEIKSNFKTTPTQLDSDNESSFLSKRFIKFCEDNNIKQNLSEPGDGNPKGIIERFNGTLRRLIERYISAFQTQDWVTVLPDLIYNYNNHKHRTIQTTPEIATENKEEYIKSQQERLSHSVGVAEEESYNREKFNVGDKVRLKLKRHVFEKPTSQFTKTIHTIVSFANEKYHVSGRKYPYRKSELLKIDKTETNPKLQEKKEEKEEKKDVNEERKEYRKTRSQQRVLNKEGVEEKNIEKDVNARVLRSHRAQRDFGPMILQ